MARSLADILRSMRTNPRDVRSAELRRVCNHYFGTARTSTGSHCVYRIPWAGDPRVNIQNARGKAKAYQVRQVLRAIHRLENDKLEPDN